MLSPVKRAPADGLLKIAGEMTIYTATDRLKDLEEALKQEGQIALDLSEVTEMDTAGLQLLLLSRHRAGPRLRLTAPSEAVKQALDTCHLRRLLSDAPTGEH